MKSSPQRSPLSATEHEAEIAADEDFTAKEQLAYLELAVKDWSAPQKESPRSSPTEAPTSDRPVPARPSAPERGAAKPAAEANKRKRTHTTIIVKSCVALAVAAVLGWSPFQRLLATTSAEATVNARLIILRAPIEGEVSLAAADSDIGTEFHAGQNILTISNPRADTAQLGNLRRDRERIKTAIGALEGRKQVLTANLAELVAQQDRFRVGRVQQLDQRVRETDTDISAAKAQLSVASDALSRAKSLKETGAVSQAFLDKAVRDANVAKEVVGGLTERRIGMLVELAAAKTGTFIGDSYNDTPQSAQRKMEVELELADVRARLEGSNAELASIESDFAAEQARQQKLSKAILQSPVHGRIWELLTAPGEHVNEGQDLLKVLDCGSAIVTASVSESAFQRLSIGQPATFRRRDDGAELQGWVVGLNGLAAVTSNSAIQQGALTREPYHVTLKFPELAKAADCQIGRTGLVKFDTAGRSLASFVP